MFTTHFIHYDPHPPSTHTHPLRVTCDWLPPPQWQPPGARSPVTCLLQRNPHRRVVFFSRRNLSGGHERAFWPLPQLHPPDSARGGRGLRLHLRKVKHRPAALHDACLCVVVREELKARIPSTFFTDSLKNRLNKSEFIHSWPLIVHAPPLCVTRRTFLWLQVKCQVKRWTISHDFYH